MNLFLMLIFCMLIIAILCIIKIYSIMISAVISERKASFNSHFEVKDKISDRKISNLSISSQGLLPEIKSDLKLNLNLNQKNILNYFLNSTVSRCIIQASAGKYFRGYAFLQVLQDTGFECNQKYIFEYKYNINNNIKIILSILLTHPPYVFLPEKLGMIETSGLYLFLHSVEYQQEMNDIAEILAEELDGVIIYEKN